MPKLTPKQKLFVDYYIETLNQSKAAIKAGYSEKTARSTATGLMKKPIIQEAIAARMAEKEQERIATQDEILGFLTSVMRGEVKEQVPLLAGDGYQQLEELDATQPKDRIKAAELLGKRYALWTEKKEIDGNIGVMIVDDIE